MTFSKVLPVATHSSQAALHSAGCHGFNDSDSLRVQGKRKGRRRWESGLKALPWVIAVALDLFHALTSLHLGTRVSPCSWLGELGSI